MKRLLVISDSVALPREKPEESFYENTYPFILSKYYQVFQCSIGGATINELVDQAHYYKQYKPDIVILQSGIVDCSPRAYTKNEEWFWGLCFFTKAIRKLLSMTITTRRLRRIRKKVWTKETKYKEECNRYISLFPGSQCFVLSIIVSPACESVNPGMFYNVGKYNRILKEIFKENYINLEKMPISGIMSDYHHLNSEGHLYVADKIMNVLSQGGSSERVDKHCKSTLINRNVGH